MIIRVCLTIVVLLTLLVGCGGQTNGTGAGGPTGSPVSVLPGEPATIVGTITRAQDNSVMVEEQPGQETSGRKIVFSLSPATKIVARRGQDFHDITAAELTVGSRVEAWANGAIAESYPEQARAATIVVTEAGSGSALR